jgi:hypothetical protein
MMMETPPRGEPRYGCHPAHLGEGSLGLDRLGIVAGSHEQDGGHLDARPVAGEQAGRGGLDERAQQPPCPGDLGAEVLDALGELAEGDVGGVPSATEAYSPFSLES